MGKAKEKTADCRWRASVTHTEKTIQRLYRTQYYAYSKGKILLRLGLGLALILAGVLAQLPTWARAVLMLLGTWFAVSGDFPAQLHADRVLQERKAALPSMRYEFYEDRIFLSGEGSMVLPYERLSRLAEDREYLYLFETRDSVCMLERASLRPADDKAFQKFIEEKTGLFWRREGSLLSFGLADLILVFRDRKRP